MRVKMNKTLRYARVFLKRNSSTILTVLGGIGLIGTTVSAIKATPEAMDILEEREEEKGSELTVFEKVEAVVPVYLPTIILGGATLGCIFGANALSLKSQASLASAYAFVDQSYKEYQSKLKELYGEEADINIRDAIARDKYNSSDPHIHCDGIFPIESIDGMAKEEERHLFYDELSERYFESTLINVQLAEYHLNRNFCLGKECPLNDFYDFLGIPRVDWGEEVGWTMLGDYYWIDFDHRKVMLDGDLECCLISPVFGPDKDYLD